MVVNKKYLDKVECPKCGTKRELQRQIHNRGKKLPFWCSGCNRMVVPGKFAKNTKEVKK